jgi:hypothetical protein
MFGKSGLGKSTAI